MNRARRGSAQRGRRRGGGRGGTISHGAHLNESPPPNMLLSSLNTLAKSAEYKVLGTETPKETFPAFPVAIQRVVPFSSLALARDDKSRARPPGKNIPNEADESKLLANFSLEVKEGFRTAPFHLESRERREPYIKEYNNNESTNGLYKDLPSAVLEPIPSVFPAELFPQNKRSHLTSKKRTAQKKNAIKREKMTELFREGANAEIARGGSDDELMESEDVLDYDDEAGATGRAGQNSEDDGDLRPRKRRKNEISENEDEGASARTNQPGADAVEKPREDDDFDESEEDKKSSSASSLDEWKKKDDDDDGAESMGSAEDDGGE